MSSLLRVDNVSFEYQANRVLRHATFDLEEGSCSALIGINGSGKSTLLRIVAGVLRPASGSVSLRGRPMGTLSLKEVARTVALVPQQLELPFAFTVEQVVEQGRTPYIGMLRGPGRSDRTAIDRALDLADVCSLRHRVFNELSGGERQRVKIALGLAQQPRLLLLDEPTQNLDIGRQVELIDLLHFLRDEGITILASIHDLHLVDKNFSTVLLLSPGQPLASGTPEQMLKPSILERAFQCPPDRHPLLIERAELYRKEVPMITTTPYDIEEVIGGISAPPEEYLAQARKRLDTLTKPLGSLGRLEDLAAQWFAIRQGNLTSPVSKAVYVFAADHGITAEGVSAYPSQVTQQMVLNFLSGGAAINVLARLNHVEVTIVDVGVDADLFGYAGLTDGKVRRGSRNMLREAAMSPEEVAAAMSVGISMAEAAHAKGNNLVAVGEMGIGNTTAASAMTAAITGMKATLVTGKGTGLDDEAYARKCHTVEAVLRQHFAQPAGPRKILRCAGGLEIAAMAGMILGAARRQIAIVMDGFISTAAAAIACGLAPAVRPYLFAGHQSQEPGHRVLLAHLEIEPILDLQMRLGEGTGAVLAMPVLEGALHLYQEMATFASAGISGATA